LDAQPQLPYAWELRERRAQRLQLGSPYYLARKVLYGLPSTACRGGALRWSEGTGTSPMRECRSPKYDHGNPPLITSDTKRRLRLPLLWSVQAAKMSYRTVARKPVHSSGGCMAHLPVPVLCRSGRI